ncbi:chondroitin AC/alginate lyase, partial [Schizopora paradoxa]
VRPPNGDPRDYLSWAPYHWPDCNWCANPRTHLSTGTNVTRNGTETWTTCPYVVRDGKLNPDVRILNGVNAVADVTQSVLYNALAAILVPTSANAKTYAKNAATFIQIFFLDPKAGVYPELQYGQLIRGPGKEVGQYLGILDFRGMVKVANAIQLMRNAKIPDWTTTLDSQMVAWSNKYVQWLTTSDLGKQAGSAPNNHGSFYANQVAAINILVGDADGARTALQTYFQNQFKDQIAASGEQPFEAVRTRPYHYRCFNLEAMITNAKLGDYLGVDFWTARSKYGATIQTALDYTMALNPGKESIVDIFPHVEAVAAVYGDPTGKYAAFLTKNFPAYASATYYFYDQPEAFNVSPTSSSKGGKEVLDATEPHQLLEEGGHPVADEVTTTAKPPQGGSDDDPDDPLPAPTISFACPAAFATGTEVQLDDGIYVTCDELKPFYGYVEEEDS